MKKLIIIAAAALSLGCGPSGAQSCNTHCDCKRTDAEVRCPGEWACNAGSCEYQCRSQCSSLPYTCPADAECNGTICSVRKSC